MQQDAPALMLLDPNEMFLLNLITSGRASIPLHVMPSSCVVSDGWGGVNYLPISQKSVMLSV